VLRSGSTGLHYTNDLNEYNAITTRWRKLVTTGAKPSPRYKHQVRRRCRNCCRCLLCLLGWRREAVRWSRASCLFRSSLMCSARVCI
jgi:hypothetical protein